MKDGEGTRIMFSVAFGDGWRLKDVIIWAYYVPDKRYTKNCLRI